jgi:uncharacterized protein YndB with AHSA1/START domain
MVVNNFSLGYKMKCLSSKHYFINFNLSMESKLTNTIYHDLQIKAPTQSVFDAVTLPEHLVNWWPFKCSGEPNVGTEYNFFFGPEYDWKGKVVQCETGTSFYIKMTKSDLDWNPTSFGFDLKENDKGTYLSFWHKDWPECNQHFKFSSFCWAMLLNGLKDYLEKGVIIPFEERN